ncbi:MAG: haloacid dehalogenase-like hydrolase [Verrucomicrobiota bacterium]|jgi:phosphoglycolate phosphatase-like HAD superfamily hydrolase|nr:haloacid dehalogenase-like hydrolase [Verrucomicrobiota bacterium]MDP7047848.1 haloacid dehalogenase-like hydrolase [Verrucomicrobiota bacterium]
MAETFALTSHEALVARFAGKVEFTSHFAPRPSIAHVVLDFDGTLSLIREGWPEVMLPMFEELLPRVDGEAPRAVRAMLLDDIMTLNGRQTIYQMMKFAERVAERGGEALDPLQYKHEYLRRLERRIQTRIDQLANGSAESGEFLLHGALALLDGMLARGWRLYLASGTDEPFVKREAELLGLTRYFGDQIYGALDNYENFSKKQVIERILTKHNVDGGSLLVVGDGYVEIENGRDAGALTLAVASDEANNGEGRFDPWKRERLLGVGADIVVPDYQDAAVLLDIIEGK